MAPQQATIGSPLASVGQSVPFFALAQSTSTPPSSPPLHQGMPRFSAFRQIMCQDTSGLEAEKKFAPTTGSSHSPRPEADRWQNGFAHAQLGSSCISFSSKMRIDLQPFESLAVLHIQIPICSRWTCPRAERRTMACSRPTGVFVRLKRCDRLPPAFGYFQTPPWHHPDRGPCFSID
jgi:hypothetical protein